MLKVGNYMGLIILIPLIVSELYALSLPASNKRWHLLMLLVWILGVFAIFKWK